MLDLIVEEIIHLDGTDFINEQDEEDDDIEYEDFKRAVLSFRTFEPSFSPLTLTVCVDRSPRPSAFFPLSASPSSISDQLLRS
ncbi:unnamed protein product [Lactuca virosa]|uniref:Uncharacterized protein n=1 Tax=Lactuca virosa TaxID=75947 RepID=A0AAU9N6T1_9ASTR|nr:unnamed protein product [Lactuca virosa]